MQVSARNVVACTFMVILFPVAHVAEAACTAPAKVLAEVGINISKTQTRSSAPGSAMVVDRSGSQCFEWMVSGTIKIMQHAPQVEYVVSGSSAGHWLYTLNAPAQPGSCYSSSITAEGGYRLDPLTGSASAGPVCWNPNDDIPHPGPEPRNCTPIWDTEGQTWLDPECDTPILLNLGAGPYDLTSAADGVRFDIRADGSPRKVAWTSRGSEVALLALDRNGNGAVDSGAELFGSATMLASGARAKHGFEALAELDADGDGLLSPHDPAWTSLVLWTDRNHDGASAAGEMQRLADSRLEWLSTGSVHQVNRRDAWGNLFRYMSRAGIRVSDTGNAREVPYYDVFLTSE
jgi:hypothetical protein